MIQLSLYMNTYTYTITLMKSKFRMPSEINVEKDPKQNVSCRVRKSIKEKLKAAAKRTPDKLPLAVLVEQVLEDYVKFVDRNGKEAKT